jgi:putative membrane protein
MVIVLAAVPLIALGHPFAVARAALRLEPRRTPRFGALAETGAASAAFAIALWFWHMPGPYALTFGAHWIYWAMHISMILSALWLWSVLLGSRRTPAVPIVAAGLASSMQMGLLGAAITFAGHPLYAPHATTTLAWGMSQLLDQQLGGTIMWVPGGVVFLVAAMLSLWSLVSTRDTALLDAESR